MDGLFWTFVLSAFLYVIAPASGARQQRNGAEDKILHGSDAKQNEFPFVVYTNSTTTIHTCSGVLIDRRWVLTAGHCIGAGSQVVLGDYIRSEFDGTEQLIPIAETILHPEFNISILNNVEFVSNNDIGLIRLAEPAKIRSDAVAKISPLKSKSFMEKMRANEKNCWTLGWGLTEDQADFYGHIVADKLQKLRTNFVNETEDAARGYSTYLSEGAMGVEADYKDLSCKRAGGCYGDSGGPIVCKQKGDWVVTGLVSFGSSLDDCITGVFGAVNVQLYYDWIQSSIN